MKNKLDIDKNLKELLNILGKDTFTYDKAEIKSVNKYFIDNLDNIYVKYEYMYCYIGEVYIKSFGGKWALNDTKGDPAYNRMCIVDWAKETTRIDPQKVLDKLLETKDEDIINKMIELTKNNILKINNVIRELGLDIVIVK